jgi:hypothetical protein
MKRLANNQAEFQTARHRVSVLTSIAMLSASILFTALAVRPVLGQQETPPEWKQVEQAISKMGSMQPGDVFKIGLPRGDMKVSVGGVWIKPALALGSWVAFKKMSNSEAMVMGDLVLSESEVAPVMLMLQGGGIEITALHNHVLDESPRVMYMHISGRGNALKLAQTVRGALNSTKTPLTAPATVSKLSTDVSTIDVKSIEKIIGFGGKANNGVYQFSVPRTEKIMDDGMEVPPAMGVATALNFQPTGEGRAAITGDFVLLASEVNPVIRALRDNGILVTALHSHMLTESPRLFFMHFWANDDAIKLARGLRAALDKTNSVKSTMK